MNISYPWVKERLSFLLAEPPVCYSSGHVISDWVNYRTASVHALINVKNDAFLASDMYGAGTSCLWIHAQVSVYFRDSLLKVCYGDREFVLILTTNSCDVLRH